MRTLKKTLCLVLVLVMMAGLCAVGTSAAFVDADKINYTEAADVLNAVGAIKGDDNGFRPQDELTRAEACVIIARLCDAEDIKGTASFTDLAGYGWASNAIAYCEAEGYVNGVGEGKFNPAGKLTGYAFSKMLLCVLGYDAKIEQYVGANWEISVAKGVKKNDLSKGISAFDGTANITREEAAQLALNALKATTVAYESKGTSVEINGATIVTGASAAAPVKATGAAADAIYGDANIATEDTVQLGEALYNGNLVLVAATNSDAMKRPAVEWQYTATGKPTVSVIAAKAPTYVLEGKVSEKTMYNTLGAVAAEKYAITVTTNGADTPDDSVAADTAGTARPDKKTVTAYAGTNLGDVTEIFVDTKNRTVDIVISETFVATVKKVTAATAAGAKRYVTLDNGLEFVTEDFTVKDVVLYTKDVDAAAGKEIQTMALAEVVTGTLTKNVNNDTFTVGGKDYKVSKNGSTTLASANLNKEYSFYVDAQGNIIKDKTAAAAADNYILILGNAASKASSDYLGNASTYTAEVYGVLADGTAVTKTVEKVGANAIDGYTYAQTVNALRTKLYTYKDADNDGLLEITVEDDAAWGSAIANKATTADSKVLNSATTFVFVNTKDYGTDNTVKSTTVKVGNANIGNGIAADKAFIGANSKNVAEVVFVVAGYTDDTTDSGDMVYLKSNSEKVITVKEENTNKTSYTYTGITTDGEEITVTSKTVVSSYAGKVFKYNEDKSLGDEVTTTKKAGEIVLAINDSAVTFTTNTYNVNDATKVSYLKEDVELKVGQTVTYVLGTKTGTTNDVVAAWVTADQATVAYTVTGATTTTYELVKGAGVVNTVKLTVDVSGASVGDTISVNDGTFTPDTLDADEIAAGTKTITVTYTAPAADVAEVVSIS